MENDNAQIVFDCVTIAAGDFQREDISLSIPTGQCGVLMGRTGCGKTTLMETLCGLRDVRKGKILVGNRDITTLPPRLRGIGYVPQDVALFTSFTVFENLAFALNVRGWEKDAIIQRVTELAESLAISGLLDRRTVGLSGGEAKRVALGRALAFHPAILCLDEPLSNLDASTHVSLCRLIRNSIESEGLTAFLITHDLHEAEMLGDSITNW